MKRLVLAGAMGAALALAVFMAAGDRSAQTATPPQLQDFDVDVTVCLAGDPGPFPGGFGIGTVNCLLAEVKALAATPNVSTNIALPSGNRTGLPFSYTGPGWAWTLDAGIGIGSCADGIDNDDDNRDGTYGGAGDLVDGADPDCAASGQEGIWAGDVSANVDLFCDGVADILAKPAGAAVPEDFMERTTAWGPGTGIGGKDETFLNTLLPGAAVMAPTVRLRADLLQLFIGGVTPFPLPNPVSLNSVTLAPVWPQPAWGAIAVANPTHATTTILGGDPTSPSSTYTCTDSPQDSQSRTYGVANPASFPPSPTIIANPAGPAGIYARWTTELSNPDHNTSTRHLAISTNCKAIGAVGLADVDSDCLLDSGATSPAPDEGTITTLYGCPDTGADRDGDGLLDGIEAAWGSDPCLADTDGDGRTDLEEMIGPAEFLSNPQVADTDGDTVPDGGYKVGGPDLDGDGTADGGIDIQVSGNAADPACGNPPSVFPCYIDGSTHVRMGFQIVGTDIVADNQDPDGVGGAPNPGRDNCPGTPNGNAGNDQLNTDLDSATQMGGGDLLGDVCDNDDDQDGMVDGSEATFSWSGTACANAGGSPLTATDPDTDGDGVLDGIECSLGSNPADGSSIPAACGSFAPARADSDGDVLCGAAVLPPFVEEVNWRTSGISGASTTDVDSDGATNGDSDPDTDGDTLSDGCEVLFAGTSPMSPDSDEDGIADNLEIVGASAGAVGLRACVSTPAGGGPPPGTGIGVIGNGTGVPGQDGTDAAYTSSRASGGFDTTYDDNNDGTWKGAGDDGPWWDLDADSIRDTADLGTSCSNTSGADGDNDGLLDKWEVCKWGTDPTKLNTDGQGGGDCKEAADVNGDGVVDFVGDTIFYAKAALLPAASFGKDGDFDINGDGVVDFVGDVIQEAKFALIANLCK